MSTAVSRQRTERKLALLRTLVLQRPGADHFFYHGEIV